MQDILNELLRQLYKARISQLFARFETMGNTEGVSNPHLIKVPEGYCKAKIKVLIVGQQTQGWHGTIGQNLGPDPVTTLMNVYEQFAHGRHYTRSPFWQAAHQLYRGLNPDGPDQGFVWTNLIKVDQYGKRAEPLIEEICWEVFNVLPEEITILKPDVIVFFTGPKYEKRLQENFKNIKYVHVDSKVDIGLLARLEHPQLPHYTFRTKHPNYLRRSKQWNVLDKIIDYCHSLNVQ